MREFETRWAGEIFVARLEGAGMEAGTSEASSGMNGASDSKV